MSQAKLSFPDAVRGMIDAQYANEKPFSVRDFNGLTKKYKASSKAITNLLRKMADKEVLRVVGEIPNPHGGGMSKRFVLPKGTTCSKRVQMGGAHYKRILAEREKTMHNAAMLLLAGLDGKLK